MVVLLRTQFIPHDDNKKEVKNKLYQKAIESCTFIKFATRTTASNNNKFVTRTSNSQVCGIDILTIRFICM